MKYMIPGFPVQQEEVIPTPNIAELLFMPVFSRCDPERFDKFATPFQKMLLQKCPLVGGYKNLVIDSYVQFLYPEMCPVGTRSAMNQLHEWHCDGWHDLTSEATTFHLFESESECATLFNAEPIEVELPDAMRINDFNTAAVSHAVQDWGVKGIPMAHNRWLSFSRHVHRAVQVTHKQFRFFFRVTESNNIAPDMQREQPRQSNPCFRVNREGRHERIDNVVREFDGISIKLPRR